MKSIAQPLFTSGYRPARSTAFSSFRRTVLTCGSLIVMLVPALILVGCDSSDEVIRITTASEHDLERQRSIARQIIAVNQAWPITAPAHWRLTAARGSTPARWQIDSGAGRAVVTLSRFADYAGTPLADIARWMGGDLGITDAPPEDAVERFTEMIQTDHGPLLLFDIPGPAPADEQARAQRVMVAQARHDQWTWFLKVLGDDEVVGRQRQAVIDYGTALLRHRPGQTPPEIARRPEAAGPPEASRPMAGPLDTASPADRPAPDDEVFVPRAWIEVVGQLSLPAGWQRVPTNEPGVISAFRNPERPGVEMIIAVVQTPPEIDTAVDLARLIRDDQMPDIAAPESLTLELADQTVDAARLHVQLGEGSAHGSLSWTVTFFLKNDMAWLVDLRGLPNMTEMSRSDYDDLIRKLLDGLLGLGSPGSAKVDE